MLLVSFCSMISSASSATALNSYEPASRAPMEALTVSSAPALRAPTSAVATLLPPRRRATRPAGASAAPLLRTVADTVISSDSTGEAGEVVSPVTSRSGLGAGVPITWNSAICPAVAPLLAVNLSWTSATRSPTGIDTLLPPLAGSKT